MWVFNRIMGLVSLLNSADLEQEGTQAAGVQAEACAFSKDQVHQP